MEIRPVRFAEPNDPLFHLCVLTFLGPEFPSLVGGAIGMVVVVSAARKGWFLPHEKWDFPSRDTWDSAWIGNIRPQSDEVRAKMTVTKAWLPYVMVATLLLLTRLPSLGLQQGLSELRIGPRDILGTGIGQQVQPFYLPGFTFLVVCILTYGVHRMNWIEIRDAWSITAKHMWGVAVALVFALPMVRLFIESGPDLNLSSLDSMPLVLARGAAQLAGGAWPFFAPWIGALGAFAAGSNTVSNLMFSLFQFASAQQVCVEPSTVVAAQAVGGAAGNMIAVHNVVAACATVGLLGREGAVIRMTLIPMTYYCLMAGSIAFIWSFGLGVNLGTITLLALVCSLVLLTRRLK